MYTQIYIDIWMYTYGLMCSFTGVAAQQNAITLAQHGTSGMLVTIPDEHVGRLIGKQGVTIKNINERCRVRCILPQQPDPGSYPPVRTITVQGDPQNQAMAKYEIETIIYNQQMQLGQTPTVFPQLPPQMAAAGAYGGSVGVYGAAAGGVYGAAAGGVYGYQQQQQYATAAAAQTQAQVAPAKDHNDPTAYYTEFWQYAAYYGEAAARAYYKAWSPPEGTPPPAGVVLPAGTAATTPTAATTTATNAADGSSSVAQPSSHSPSSSSSPAAVASTTTAEGATLADEAAAREAWEKYEREMAEWKRLYGDQAAATSTTVESATAVATAPTNEDGGDSTDRAVSADATEKEVNGGSNDQ